MPEPSIGRIVQYVLRDGPSKGQSRPAQIVNLFAQSVGEPLLNLVVTLDGENDVRASDNPHRHSYIVHRGQDGSPDGENGYTWGAPPMLHNWQTSVPYAEAVGSPPTYSPGTWHWPPGMS